MAQRENENGVAIIDIGSNSVRIVIYQNLLRAPMALFNEKVLCGLGRHIATTGRLEDEGMRRAFIALKRFRVLAEQNGAVIHALATAAVRDAENGAEFVEKAQGILQSELKVLSGRQEAFYAALGIVCGFQKPQGLAADMGGGSVEFTLIDGLPTGEGMTLPLGGLRLLDEYGGEWEAADKQVELAIGKHELFRKAMGGTFYAVGGTWRTFAALHMEQIGYPVRVMHHYELEAKQVKKLCRHILENKVEKIDGVKVVSSSRREMLPYGAMVLEKILAAMKPEKIIFSAFGVREGYLYSLLAEEIQKDDPLLVAAQSMARRYSRSLRHAEELDSWTKRAWGIFGVEASGEQERLRKVACWVSDISWRDMPDYRAEQALSFLLNANFVGIDHQERAFVALASYYRYQGIKKGIDKTELCELAGEELLFRAKLMGGLLRLAYLFSAGESGILSQLAFEKEKTSEIKLLIPNRLADFAGEPVHRRIKDMGKILQREIKMEIVD